MAFKTTIIQGREHRVAELMAPQNDLLDGSDCVVGANDLLVTQNSPVGMSVLVAAGKVYSYISSSATYYRHHLEDLSTSLNIDPNSSGATRIDLICVKTDLTVAPDINGIGSVSLVVVKGTAGAGVPATPANHTKRAEVTVLNGAVSISNTNINNTLKSIKLNTSLNSTNGWTPQSDTWIYASASTFTITGVDRTAVYTKGTRLRFKQGAGYKYGVVISSAFSTNTTVTIAVNTDHTIANSTITDSDYSYAANPQGYPDYFNYTETWTGFSVAPSGGSARFSIIGRRATVTLGRADGTSNSQALTASMPVAAETDVFFFGQGKDGGGYLAGASPGYIAAGAAIATFYQSVNQSVGSWTGGGGKNWLGNISYYF